MLIFFSLYHNISYGQVFIRVLPETTTKFLDLKNATTIVIEYTDPTPTHERCEGCKRDCRPDVVNRLVEKPIKR